MELGAFSVSLAVKDLAASRVFYEKFGFTVFGGDASQNWLILKNGDHVIGLFQGMFEKNILTFNPGWDSNAVDCGHRSHCKPDRHIRQPTCHCLSDECEWQHACAGVARFSRR